MALSTRQIAQLWVQHGGDPKYANLMARIAKRESGGRPKVNNRGLNKNGTVDWGLYQVNDIWRRDPVVGPLFQSGAILTPDGATKAAIRIFRVQGPKAWATYNPSVDQKYLGGFQTAGSSAPRVRARTTTTPGVDRSAERLAALSNYVANPNMPGASASLALGLLAAKDTPPKSVRRVTVTGGRSTGGSGRSRLLELFWQGQGGINVKDGHVVPQGFVDGHTDHVHVAAGSKTVVQLGELAKRMGLHVGENPHFGGVHPVHVQNSYHYRGEAIDVSGDPARMRRYAHTVARLYGLQGKR